MSETDILNPRKGYDPEFKDSMNPNIGWQRTRKSTLAIAKPAFGRPYQRETANTGHTYTLNYTRRNCLVTDRLKRFFEQFEDGFFTFIDWDTKRHYVGNFVGDMPQTFDVNGRFSSTSWTFVEIPGCPMLEYPSDWDRWAIFQYPVDDYGEARTAVNSGNWVRPPAVADDSGSLGPRPRQLQNLAPAAGDWATHEYRGYGFRLWAGVGPEYGQVNLYVDGVFIELIDLYNAAEQGVTIVYENASMALDIHRVQLILPATKNLASSGNGMLLDKFEVMR